MTTDEIMNYDYNKLTQEQRLLMSTKLKNIELCNTISGLQNVIIDLQNDLREVKDVLDSYVISGD